MDTRTPDLTFTVKKSIRYHDYKRAFYRAVVSWIHFLCIVAGFAALATLTTDLAWKSAFPAALIVLSAAGLVGRVGEKRALHTDLYKRWVRLEQEYLKGVMTLDQLEIASLEIEIDEPPIYKALNRHCHNEVLLQEDQANKILPLDRRHRLFNTDFHYQNLHLIKAGITRCREPSESGARSPAEDDLPVADPGDRRSAHGWERL